MTEPVIFSSGIEGLQRALGPLLTDVAKERLAAVGLDLRKPVLPAYPLETWLKVIAIAGELVAPGEPPEARSETLGRRFIAGYSTTLLGSAVLGMLRALGPRRALERMTNNFRSANNYTQTRLEVLGPTEFRLHFNLVHNRDFYRGMLTELLTRTGVAAPTVRVESGGPGESTAFHLSWDL